MIWWYLFNCAIISYLIVLFSSANSLCLLFLVIFDSSMHLRRVDYVFGQSWLVSYKCLSLSSNLNHVTFFIYRIRWNTPPPPFFNPLFCFLCWFFFILIVTYLVNCICFAVQNTHCTKWYNAVCCWRLKTLCEQNGEENVLQFWIENSNFNIKLE